MKKGLLLILLLGGMISSCSQSTCPTYMYLPDHQNDIQVKIEKSTTQSTSEVNEAS